MVQTTECQVVSCLMIYCDGCWRQQSWHNFRSYPGICLEGLMKNRNNFNPSWDWNSACPRYKLEALPLEPTFSVAYMQYSDVLTAVQAKIQVFWDIIPCRLVNRQLPTHWHSTLGRYKRNANNIQQWDQLLPLDLVEGTSCYTADNTPVGSA
jgi:hypothetical protein